MVDHPRLKFSQPVTHRRIRLEEGVEAFVDCGIRRLGRAEQERRQTHGRLSLGSGRKQIRQMVELVRSVGNKRACGASRQKGDGDFHKACTGIVML